MFIGQVSWRVYIVTSYTIMQSEQQLHAEWMNLTNTMLTKKSVKACNLHNVKNSLRWNDILLGDTNTYGKSSESKGKPKTKLRIIAVVSEVQRRGINWGWAHKLLLRFDQVLLVLWGQQWQVSVCRMHRSMAHFSMCTAQLRKSRLWIHNTGNSSERKI